MEKKRMEKKRMEILDAAKGEEEELFSDIGISTRARLGTVDVNVKFLDNITILLNKPIPDWPEQSIYVARRSVINHFF